MSALVQQVFVFAVSVVAPALLDTASETDTETVWAPVGMLLPKKYVMTVPASPLAFALTATSSIATPPYVTPLTPFVPPSSTISTRTPLGVPTGVWVHERVPVPAATFENASNATAI